MRVVGCWAEPRKKVEVSVFVTAVLRGLVKVAFRICSGGALRPSELRDVEAGESANREAAGPDDVSCADFLMPLIIAGKPCCGFAFCRLRHRSSFSASLSATLFRSFRSADPVRRICRGRSAAEPFSSSSSSSLRLLLLGVIATAAAAAEGPWRSTPRLLPACRVVLSWRSGSDTARFPALFGG